MKECAVNEAKGDSENASNQLFWRSIYQQFKMGSKDYVSIFSPKF